MSPDIVLPSHVAIIMDGNGRWAKAQNRERTYGHQQGVETVRSIVRASREFGISSLTLFTFSSENWKRPRLEVQTLFKLFTTALNKYLAELIENGVHLRFIGNRSVLGKTLVAEIVKAEKATEQLSDLYLNIALNYGGRWDIANSCYTLMKQGTVPADCDELEKQLDQQLKLCSAGDVDLLIRTGGEQRLSNFFLWQSAYAELYFSDKLWPDFDKHELQKALEWFSRCERRFGTINDG